MGDKSLRKKQYIIRKAREVFVARGFKDVTMKDIVEACEISRGGLYLYFQNTSDIFMAVLAGEDSNGDEDGAEDDVFVKAMKAKASSADILALFMQEQKKELCNTKDNLAIASYEFFFANKIEAKENLLKQQFDAAVAVLEKLIQDGVKDNDLVCDDPKGAARNIMYVLEGLRIMSQTVGISEKEVNKEILYLMKQIIKEEV